ncbi:MAG: hypothetical protein CMF34_13745 [Leeuwenhoekiella sp.]|nr:hypothetical protein [Leeuwenhoekiella sp.]MAW93936.1 hypothetical protein [Leeuwenhoekiella sp.]MBA81650.1 hypothetical protein [Leeuwenhoekiella sp.]
MTHRLLVFLLLIFFLFTGKIEAQHIQLEIQSDDKKSDSIAATYIPTRIFPDQKNLEQYLSAIKDSLLNNGFFKHQIIKLNKPADTVYAIKFISGRKTEIFKLQYEQPSILSYANRLELKADSSYIYIRPRRLKSALEDFVILDSKNGRPLASYSIKNISLSKDTAFAQLFVATNQNLKLNEVVIKGYDKFPKSFLKHFAKLQNNSPYNEESINKKINYLKQLDFITQIKEPDILFKKDTTTLYLYLGKENSNQLEGFLGFASQENSNNVRLNGYLDLNLVNTLNYGEQLKFKFQGNGDNQQQLEASLRMPYLFRSPLSLTPGLRLFRQDSIFSNSQTKLKIDYTWSPKFKTNAQVEQISSTKLEVGPSATIEDFRKTLLTTGFEISRNKSSSDPFDTNYLNFEIGYSSRNTDNQETKLNQLIFNLDAAYLFDFSKKHKFYIKNTTAYISPKDIFENEMYRFGGMHTLRGYKENDFYASFFSAFQSEYVFKPVEGLILNTVVDAAYYKNHVIQKSEILYGTGIGASIPTNAGWLSLNMTTPFSNDSNLRLSNTILHLKLISRF